MRLIVLVLVAAPLIPLAIMAGVDSVPPVTDPLVKEECGACHMAFQPVFLPATSWQKIMSTLDNHFGEDASLDIGGRDKIQSYLVANARRSNDDHAALELRITELNWFRREHNESEVKKLRTQHNLVSMTDCLACHRNADQGKFEDD